MFGKKDYDNNYNNTDQIDTIIGKNSKIEGKITTNGTIRIDGTLDGDLFVQGNVIIGESGRVNGNVECFNIELSGTITGNTVSKEQLRITNSGKLLGDIVVKSFIVDENAVFEGSCTMKSDKSEIVNNEKNKKTANKDAKNS